MSRLAVSRPADFSLYGNTITKKQSQLFSECLESTVKLNSVCKLGLQYVLI